VKRALIALAIILSACTADKPAQPQFHADENPQLLSEWNVISVADRKLVLGENVVPYALNSSLFTDYAHKLRTVWMPEGYRAQWASGDVKWPVGTVISKSFYYPKGAKDGHVLKSEDLQPVNAENGLNLDKYRIIETRLLVHRAQGWEPLSYIWNAEQTEARLSRIGDIINLTLVGANQKETPFPYSVPNINQCAGCHAPNNTTRVIEPIGATARHMNRDYGYAEGARNQFEKLYDVGFTEEPPATLDRAAIWNHPGEPLNDRARAYLEINCAHCHNPVGPADTSGLHLGSDAKTGPHLGLCKTSIAAGAGTGGRDFDIDPGDPENSIFVYRMETRDPGAMMPELGRSLSHDEGVALIASWIREMEGNCG